MTSRPVTEEAERIVDAWEAEEGESMREGHRATLERLIAVALSEARRDAMEEAWATAFKAVCVHCVADIPVRLSHDRPGANWQHFEPCPVRGDGHTIWFHCWADTLRNRRALSTPSGAAQEGASKDKERGAK